MKFCFSTAAEMYCCVNAAAGKANVRALVALFFTLLSFLKQYPAHKVIIDVGSNKYCTRRKRIACVTGSVKSLRQPFHHLVDCIARPPGVMQRN